MPYKKIKSENYSEVGGINQKNSLFKTGETEVLDLVNLDFSEPGAWTSRWGFTNSLVSGNTLSIGASNIISAIWQIFPATDTNTFFSEIPGARILFGHNNGIYKVSTYGSTSFIYNNLLTGMTGSNWNFANYQAQSYFTSGSGQTLVSGPAPAYKFSPLTFGATFTEDNLAYFGLPKAEDTMGASVLLTGPTLATTIANGTYSYQYAYIDRFGFIGPRSATLVFGASNANGINRIVLSGMTTGTAASFGYQNNSQPINVNSNSILFGNMILFRDQVPGFPSTDMVAITRISYTPAGSNIFFRDDGVYPLATFFEPTPVDDLYGSFSKLLRKEKYLEIYQNRLFAGGDDNILYFSEPDNLEQIFPESFLAVGDNKFSMSGLKSFNQSLMIFLRKGVEKLTGDSPVNFNKQIVIPDYGCLSHKSIVEFNNKLWFLDESGIIEWTGAAYDQVSERMKDTFATMNISAAANKAFAINVIERNEVWFSIPINGSEINNIVVVYDYFANAWTTFKSDKLKPTAINYIYQSVTLGPINRDINNKSYLFGSIGSSLYNFSPYLTGDDGAGLTLSWRTRFHDAGGSKSSTAQFRRFFVDAKISAGSTQIFGQTISLSFYSNYASNTISMTLPLSLTTFTENRVEFGIPAKSLATEVAFGASTNMKVQFYGYTIESRYQRSV